MTKTVEPITDEARQIFWKEAAILNTKGSFVSGDEYLNLAARYESALSAAEEENKRLREALLDVYPLAVVYASNYSRLHDVEADFSPQHAQLFLRIAQLLEAPELEKVARNALTKGKDDGKRKS